MRELTKCSLLALLPTLRGPPPPRVLSSAAAAATRQRAQGKPRNARLRQAGVVGAHACQRLFNIPGRRSHGVASAGRRLILSAPRHPPWREISIQLISVRTRLLIRRRAKIAKYTQRRRRGEDTRTHVGQRQVPDKKTTHGERATYVAVVSNGETKRPRLLCVPTGGYATV